MPNTNTKPSILNTRALHPTDGAYPRKVNLIKKNMTNNYANVCKLACIKEEVILNFGVNEGWEQGLNEVTVELKNRLILNPYMAKRLLLALENILAKYEAHYGVLTVFDNKPENINRHNMTLH